MEIGEQKEVFFHLYCTHCKHKDESDDSDVCNDCLDTPTNVYSHKPINFKDKEE